MTIRRQLSLSHGAILVLLGCNLVFYSWSDIKRKSSVEALRRAIARQSLISSIQQKLNDYQKQVSLLGQITIGPASSGVSAEEIAQFNRGLDSIGNHISEVSSLSDAEARGKIEIFKKAFSELSASWRVFYENFGRNQSRAITEVVIRAEPLSQKVIQELLPQLQQDEKERVEAATARFYHTARITDQVTVAVFIGSCLLMGPITMVVARHFARGLDALKAGADALGIGNLKYRIPIFAKDEFGELGNTFNTMAERLDSARAELTMANAELEKHQEELRMLMEAAQAASKAKSQFLANMSHELRTPMNAIIGYSEMLVEEAEGLGQKAFVPDLQKINIAGKHLLTLISDILDLSKIEAGKMDLNLETFDAGKIIHDIGFTMQAQVSKNANTLIIDVPHQVGTMHADLTKVRQILFNLLSNACKFTASGKIRLVARRQRMSDRDWIEVEVTDSGIGMTSEQAAKVFDAFTQADGSTTRKYGGTGLGLTISKKFCEMMGGGIRVESEPGKGTTFTVSLPAEGASEPREAGFPDNSRVPSPAV
jgi:signal transduction histidine kinase